jgi:hypothetical protein
MYSNSSKSIVTQPKKFQLFENEENQTNKSRKSLNKNLTDIQIENKLKEKLEHLIKTSSNFEQEYSMNARINIEKLKSRRPDAPGRYGSPSKEVLMSLDKEKKIIHHVPGVPHGRS